MKMREKLVIKDDVNNMINDQPNGKSKNRSLQISHPNKRSWTSDQMRAAVNAVREKKLNMKSASEKFNIPLSTLSVYLKENKPIPDDHEQKDNIDENTNMSNESMEDDINSNFDERSNDDSNSIMSISTFTSCSLITNANKKTSGLDFSDDQNANDELKRSLTDSPRITTMAKKSTSPLKFFLFNRPKLTSTSSISSSSNDVKEIKQTSSVNDFGSLNKNLKNNNNYKRANQARNKFNNSESSSSLDNIISLNDKDKISLSTISFINSIIYDDLVSKKLDGTQIKNDIKQKLIQEYEKPFKIYAYLGLRQRYHPVYLNRNLNYMLKKMPKNSTSKRKSFKLDNLINKLKEESHNKSIENEDSGDIVLVMLDDDDEEINTDKEVIIKFDSFQIKDPTLTQLLIENCDDKNDADDSDDMLSYVELYGLTSKGSNTPVLIGKCPINLNTYSNQQSKNSDSSIKTKISNLTSGKINYLIFRLIIKIKFNHKCNKRKISNNGSSNSKKIKILNSPNGIQQPQQQEIRKSKRISLTESTTNDKLTNSKQTLNNSAQLTSKMETQQQQSAETPSKEKKDYYLEFNLMCSFKKGQNDKINTDNLLSLNKKQFTFEMTLSQLDKDVLNLKKLNGSKIPNLKLDEDIKLRINPLITNDFESFNKDFISSRLKSENKTNHIHDHADDVKNLIVNFYNYSKSNLLKFGFEIISLNDKKKNFSPTMNKSNSLRSSPRLSPTKSINNTNNRSTAVELNKTSHVSVVLKGDEKRMKRSVTNPNIYKDSHSNYSFKSSTSSDKFKNDDLKSNSSSFNIFYQFNLNEVEKTITQSSRSNKTKNNNNNNNNNNTHNILTQMSPLVEKSSLNVFTCPFCCLNCKYLISLIKHLDNCHFRFTIKFNLTNHTTGKGSGSLNTNLSSNLNHPCNDHKTDLISLNDNTNLNLVNGGYSGGLNGLNVGFNTSNNLNNLNINNYLNIKNGKVKFEINYDEIYDGSYLGNPYDWQYSAHLGYSKSRIKPTKRVSVTYVIVNKKNNFLDLSQFTDLMPNELAALNFILQQQQKFNYQLQPNKAFNCEAGFERMYYHTSTTLPIHPSEIDIDSDEELDPDWLKEQTALLINEFADVNEGEKGIMKLWNLHCLKNNFIADSQVYQACETFIVEQKELLFSLNLVNNFLLHLANLYDYGLLKLNQIINLTDILHSDRPNNNHDNNDNSITEDTKSSNHLNNKNNNINGFLNGHNEFNVDQKSKVNVIAANNLKNNNNRTIKSTNIK